MLIIANRALSQGKMVAGNSYEVDDEEGQFLIDAGLAISGETLRDRDPNLAEQLAEAVVVDVDLNRGNEVTFEEVTGESDVAL